ncbi:MAG TPA: bifunctional precorrin-2 dehydrogenase/sirohydrochlorin ferrochelatase [Bryobacteraceae bacterium]|nr:bifunctional precorrin-2 dehydrogenase/sirohydrochlorin ferrochelatase [Bryobacteraceae bacterium]
MNFRYPIFLDLTGKRCLVTGEGYEVAGKVRGLMDAAAQVTYVNPGAELEMQQLAAAGLIVWHARNFETSDLDGCFLVISDLDDNAPIFHLCEQRGILCNSVDNPEHCRFSFGSIHRRGDLTIAISTNGWAPAVAVRLKERLQREIGPEFETLLQMLKEVRPEITSRVADFGARKALWYGIVDSDLLQLLREGRRHDAQQALRQLIEDAVSSILRSDTSSDDAHR